MSLSVFKVMQSCKSSGCILARTSSSTASVFLLVPRMFCHCCLQNPLCQALQQHQCSCSCHACSATAVYRTHCVKLFNSINVLARAMPVLPLLSTEPTVSSSSQRSVKCLNATVACQEFNSFYLHCNSLSVSNLLSSLVKTILTFHVIQKCKHYVIIVPS